MKRRRKQKRKQKKIKAGERKGIRAKKSRKLNIILLVSYNMKKKIKNKSHISPKIALKLCELAPETSNTSN